MFRTTSTRITAGIYAFMLHQMGMTRRIGS